MVRDGDVDYALLEVVEGVGRVRGVPFYCGVLALAVLRGVGKLVDWGRR